MTDLDRADLIWDQAIARYFSHKRSLMLLKRGASKERSPEIERRLQFAKRLGSILLILFIPECSRVLQRRSSLNRQYLCHPVPDHPPPHPQRVKEPLFFPPPKRLHMTSPPPRERWPTYQFLSLISRDRLHSLNKTI